MASDGVIQTIADMGLEVRVRPLRGRYEGHRYMVELYTMSVGAYVGTGYGQSVEEAAEDAYESARKRGLPKREPDRRADPTDRHMWDHDRCLDLDQENVTL